MGFAVRESGAIMEMAKRAKARVEIHVQRIINNNAKIVSDTQFKRPSC